MRAGGIYRGILGQWRGAIPLRPWAIRGFSNEESIHTAPIQLTLSANPLRSAVPLCARPARSSPPPLFLPFFSPRSPSRRSSPLHVRENPFGLSSAESYVGEISFTRPRERGHVREREKERDPPLVVRPYFSQPSIWSPSFRSTHT